ncbi:hypothetical protein [Hoeflea sp. TYP-13]|uniref:hypothetical protein n=1 Tax=Hoeflea sp. TYP-13 TaxID=3230023 RepID=UPI0034C5D41C
MAGATQEQISEAIRIIQMSGRDDAMTLMVHACIRAVEHQSQNEAACFLEAEHEAEYAYLATAFSWDRPSPDSSMEDEINEAALALAVANAIGNPDLE